MININKMLLQINNIEFNFKQCGSDLINDQENLGIGHLIMPGNMAKRFAKECACNDQPQIPYYEIDETQYAGSDHECYNSDTQIVLMNWLFDKKRKYKIDYYGIYPFWICHDSFHAQNDVWSYQVSGINSWIERQRLLQGAERAKELGIGMLADTLLKLDTNWISRWKWTESNSLEPLKISEFYKYLRNDSEKEIYDFYEGSPDEYKTPFIPSRY